MRQIYVWNKTIFKLLHIALFKEETLPRVGREEITSACQGRDGGTPAQAIFQILTLRTFLIDLDHIADGGANGIEICAALKNRLQAILLYVAEGNVVRLHPARHLHTGVDLAVCRHRNHSSCAFTERK